MTSTIPAAATRVTSPELEALMKAERARVERLKEQYWDTLMIQFGITDPAAQGVPQVATYLFGQLSDALNTQLMEAITKFHELQALTENTVRIIENVSAACANGDTATLVRFLNEVSLAKMATAPTA
jgi:hypothetical protein